MNDSLLDQLERDGPEAQADRAIGLLLRREWGDDFVDRVSEQFPRMTMATLKEQLDTFS